MISLCFSLHLLFCFLFTAISFLTFLLRFHLNYYYIIHNWKIPCISLFWLLELVRLWWMTLLRCVKNSIWILFGRRRRTFGPSIVTIRIGGEQRLWAKSTVVLLTPGERSHAAKACKCWKKWQEFSRSGSWPDGLPVALDTVNFSTAEKLLGHCSRAVMFINTNVKLVWNRLYTLLKFWTHSCYTSHLFMGAECS